VLDDQPPRAHTLVKYNEGGREATMEAYAKLSEKIKRGEYDDAAGTKLSGELSFFNDIDAYMASRSLTNVQRDALWKEYFSRQTAKVMRFRARPPGK
jgi:hypothetical protein